jgi:hypothetical protein
VFGSGLNKSVLFDISIASSDGATTFSLYGDPSGIEWLPLGADRHAGYTKTTLSSFMQMMI